MTIEDAKLIVFQAQMAAYPNAEHAKTLGGLYSLIEELEQYRALGDLARLRAERDKAVADMKVMAIAMRESEELSEGCCFACIYDAQNLPDNVMLAYGECPGYDRDDCFEWRGTEGKA